MRQVFKKSNSVFGHAARKVGRIVRPKLQHLFSLPIFAKSNNFIWKRRRAAYASSLPRPHPEDVLLLETLKRDGVVIFPVTDLGWPGTQEMLAALEQLVGELEGAAVETNGQAEIPHARIRAHPALNDWGASPRVRSFMESYLELPAFYGAPRVMRQAARGGCHGVRRWHLDVEDFRVVKLIIYLNDVEAGGGPFEYFSRDKGAALADMLRYRGGGLATEEKLREAGLDGEASETACLARHTAILVDTARILHRAQPPVHRDRHAVTFSWFSIYGFRYYHPHGRVLM
jgi:hypothetical protein